MENKKALSGVVTAIILIAITLSAGVIVATMITGFVKGSLNTSASCYNIVEYNCFRIFITKLIHDRSKRFCVLSYFDGCNGRLVE